MLLPDCGSAEVPVGAPLHSMPAPDSIIKLCETFADHREHFRSGTYNEALLRQKFLAPFFKSLGWDMDNAQRLAPQYRDVIHEDALKIGMHTKAPDYAFTIHGQRKFFSRGEEAACYPVDSASLGPATKWPGSRSSKSWR